MLFFREYSAFLGRHRHWLGFGFLTVFWANLGQTFFISWFGAEIQSSLELSASAYGGIYSAATLASGITIIYFGALLDRVELKKYTSLVSLGLVAACGLLASANDVITLALAFYLVRLTGQGLFSHIGYTSMARYFDQGRGKAITNKNRPTFDLQ